MCSKLRRLIQCLKMILLTMIVLVTSSCGSISKENIMIQELLRRGYPQMYLDSMPDAMKKELYNHSYLRFENGCVISSNPDMQISTIEINKEGEAIDQSLFLSDVNLSIQVNRNIDSGNLEVICSYTWESTPQCRWNDPIIIMWDSQKYTLVDDSFSKTDKYVLEDTSSHIVSCDSGYAYATPSGICWYADLVETNEATAIYGKSKFYLKPNTNDGSDIFYISYIHAMMPAAISIQNIQHQSFEILNSDMPYTVNTLAYSLSGLS